jgi:medium-chain acyl-[acyl-carrier-protein] hydrolase
MKWLQCRGASSLATLRLFCFPYAGGGASVLRRWATAFPPTVEVCGIQLPGRGPRIREAPYTRLSSLVDDLGEALRPYLQPPFVFFGHSLGALVGFELVRHLRRHGGPSPVLLVVSGCSAPHRPLPGSPIHTLPDAEFLEKLDRLNGTPRAVLDEPELMQLLLPALRADFETYETYVYSPEPPLTTPISAYAGLQDTRVSHEHLEAWREQTTADFSLREFPGGHFFLHTAAALLMEALCRDLSRAGAMTTLGLHA